MEEANQATMTWRKSTRSNGSGDCVEVADNLPGVVGLRDSKDPRGPILAFDPAAWSTFVAGVKHETFRN
ncbi:hypothetical protein J3R08_004797 [Micromonospora sp. HB375]|nr:toxin-antitoxin system, toxin component [Micromonospora sp. M42]MBP1784947.1 hypothetical protein [Micromonospora sp. HB375]MDH6470550.1 hypothetical protein [Micromonospora sp. H404/HB375]ODB77598.1 DUF397 domain-containing protein [Micromonospora sp. II]PPA60826.1 DUF397 domain-containing protein [Micromonospora chalcea]